MSIDIEISEVGPRDGLQSLDSIMSTDAKKAWIKAQFEAGTPEIEVGSFVPASLLPQLADTAELVEYATTLEGLTVAVLVPNLRGLEAAVATGATVAEVTVDVTDTAALEQAYTRARVARAQAELLCQQVGGQRAQLLTVQDHLSAGTRMTARDRLYQAGFAHPVGAHDAGHFALGGLQRDAVQDLRMPVVQGQVFDLQHSYRPR